jgi:hypothetical protein
MINKRVVLFAFLLGIFFLSACTTDTGSVSGVDGAYTCFGDEEQMVLAEFAEFAPVSSEDSPYQPGEEIDIEVVLTNKLPTDIDAGNLKVKLTGEAAIGTIFSGASEESATLLYGTDPQTCLEEEIEIDIGPIVYQGDITTKINKEISGEYCYKEPVVVKAFLYFTDDAGLIGDGLPSDSNPPSGVQVTDIEQNPVNVNPGINEGEMRFKIFVENVGDGTIVEDLNSCFAFREAGYREEFKMTVKGPYTLDCPEDIRLSRDEKADVVTCKVSGIDTTNLGEDAVEITITLSDFAYEDTIPSTTIWLEP